MERRWGNRLIVDELVRIHRNGSFSAAHLQDVSLSGAFLRTRLRIPSMTRVSLQISVSHDGGFTQHSVDAYVVRQVTDGLALEWCDFAPPVIISLINGSEHIMPARERRKSVRASSRREANRESGDVPAAAPQPLQVSSRRRGANH